MNFIFFPMHFFLVFSYGKLLSSFVYVTFYCVGAGIITLMSISDRLDLYFFRRKMEKTRYVKERMDGNVFISRQSRHFSLYKQYNWSTFPSLYLDLACKQIYFPPREVKNRRNKRTITIIWMVTFWYSTFQNHWLLALIETFFSS